MKSLCPFISWCKIKISYGAAVNACTGNYQECYYYLRRKGQLKNPLQWLVEMEIHEEKMGKLLASQHEPEDPMLP